MIYVKLAKSLHKLHIVCVYDKTITFLKWSIFHFDLSHIHFISSTFLLPLPPHSHFHAGVRYTGTYFCDIAIGTCGTVTIYLEINPKFSSISNMSTFDFDEIHYQCTWNTMYHAFNFKTIAQCEYSAIIFFFCVFRLIATGIKFPLLQIKKQIESQEGEKILCACEMMKRIWAGEWIFKGRNISWSMYCNWNWSRDSTRTISPKRGKQGNKITEEKHEDWKSPKKTAQRKQSIQTL